MGMTNFLAQQLADHVLRNVPYDPPEHVYLALMTSLLDLTTGDGDEVTGGSYARAQVDFNPADETGLANNMAAVIFNSMPECEVVGGVLYDSDGGGNALYAALLPETRMVDADENIVFPIGEIAVLMNA